jgi:hypothetical protein
MEGEKIFGSCKWKPNLLPKAKGDSHRHDHVNFSRPHVNTHIGKSHVQIEQLHVMLISMKWWISLMEVLKSWNLCAN